MHARWGRFLTEAWGAPIVTAMEVRRSWLCPTEIDRMRVVEASDRVRRARVYIWLAIGATIAFSAPWNGLWTLLLFIPAGLNLALLERMLERSDRPERWAMGTMVFLMLLFAAAIPLTGGANGAAVPLVIIPAAVTPMRFRGVVVLAMTVLTAITLLAVCLAFDPSGAVNDPRLIFSTIALLISVTLANWALVEAEMKQRDAAVLDPLTGLLNRKALEVRALELEQQAALTGASVALIACDLDRFKDVNDTHGHDRGDAVLRSFAYQMRKALRSFELIYRLGGEEFLIVIPGADLDEGMAIAERLRETIQQDRPGGLDLTASFGVSASSGKNVVYERLFKAADKALYAAKDAGRNRVVAAGAPEPAPLSEPALAPAG
jgi:diguanylate cyclase (GGDEF)-like protein